MKKRITIFFCLLFLSTLVEAQVFHDNSSSMSIQNINGAATWTEDPASGDFIYDNAGTGLSLIHI